MLDNNGDESSNSDGAASRWGKVTLVASPRRTSSLKLAIIGMSTIPRATVTTLMPNWARSRAAVTVMPTTPAADAA